MVTLLLLTLCKVSHFWIRRRKPKGSWNSCAEIAEAIIMVHYFQAALWWLRWASSFVKTTTKKNKQKKKPLQTLSTPVFSWQGTVIFRTWTFAQSGSLILFLDFHFSDTVILETFAHQPPFSALPPSVFQRFSSHSLLLLLVFLLLLHTEKITCSSFSLGCVTT